MWHADNQEGDEEGSAEERGGETGSRVEMGNHGGDAELMLLPMRQASYQISDISRFKMIE